MSGIELSGVAKSFRTVPALRGVNLTVRPGEVVTLLGPNGAGKSTLIRILSTIIVPDEGEVHIAGLDAIADPAAARTKVGLVLADDRSFFWRLSGKANLEFFAAIVGLSKKDARDQIAIALEAVALSSVADRRVDRYSTGMRARLAIARSLLGDAEVLLLDEPTRSLDPVATRNIREAVKDLATTRGISVLYATHDLHEAAEIASRTMILVGGQIAAEIPGGTQAETLEEHFMALVDPSVEPQSLEAP